MFTKQFGSNLRFIPFRHGMMLVVTELCSLLPVQMALTFNITVAWRKLFFTHFFYKFLHQFGWNLVSCHMLSRWSWYLIDLVWAVFKGALFYMILWKVILACTLMLISFKLCMLRDIIKLYRLIPVWRTLTVVWNHKVKRKVQLVWFCCEVAWRCSNFCSGSLCEGNDWKEVL